MSNDPIAKAVLEIASRIGQGAARDYALRRQEIDPERQEEFLGCCIVGLEQTISEMAPFRDGALAAVVDAAITAFVGEASRWPAHLIEAEPAGRLHVA